MYAKNISVLINGNQHLNFIVLSELVKLIDTETGFHQLLQIGCDAELIDQLRHRSVRDLLSLATRTRGFIVNVTPDELLNQLGSIDRQRRDDELCEYFVLHGASRQMIAKLFKRSAEEIRKLREVLIGSSSVGRASMPKDTNVRDAIHRTWHEITQKNTEDSLRNWIYELHQKFPDYSIESLHSTIREFDDSTLEKSQKTDFIPFV